MHRLLAALLALFLLATPAPASPLAERVTAVLSQAPGVRWGMLAVDEDGREVVSIAPDERFIPASNTKLFTTCAAFWALRDLDQPDAAGGAAVRLEGAGVPTVVLVGNGDARLSSAPDCVLNCLAELADAVAARTRVVGDVVGDDSLFPDQRWSPGMSWNNIPTRSGTAISALTLDDNEAVITVTPTAPGRPPVVTSDDFTVDNRAITTASGEPGLLVHRLPGDIRIRLSGTLPAAAGPQRLRLGVDDPAHRAASRLADLLRARGVRVTGGVAVRHRPPGPLDAASVRAAPVPRAPALLRLTPPPLRDDLLRINKASQNLGAELLLRRLGMIRGAGSVEQGLAIVDAMLGAAGAPSTGHDLHDGSGMSTYNRVTPRTTVTLLRWAAGQPWGPAFRDTLPVGGVDGTLANRFRGTALEGRVHAKTGSLHATHALAGTLLTPAGRALTFAIYANDVPPGTNAVAAMDRALLALADAQ